MIGGHGLCLIATAVSGSGIAVLYGRQPDNEKGRGVAAAAL